MKISITLRTNEPHSVFLNAENDEEKRLLQIFDGTYKAEASAMRPDFHYHSENRLPEGVRIDLTKI